MRILTLILLVCGLTGSAHAQGTVTQNLPPYTGTAIGNGYTFATGGTLFIATNIAAYNMALPISVSLWVKLSSTPTVTEYFLNALNQTSSTGFAVLKPFFDTADSYVLRSELHPGTTNCNGATRMCANASLITDNRPHHLCATWSPTGSAFYIDGQQWAWGPRGAAFTPNTTYPWIIGQNVPVGSSEIDVAVWNRALTPDECVAINNRGHAGFSLLSGNAPASLNDQLVAYWSLSNCTGTIPSVTCPDASVNNNPVINDPPPSVAVTVNGTTNPTGVTGTATIASTCTDMVAVNSVAFQVDGKTFATDTTSPFTTTFDTTLVDDVTNPHVATAVCTNLGGNTASASTNFSTNNGTITPRTFYLAQNGLDTNSGTSSGSPWLSPNHNVRCGDTILAAPGNLYLDNQFFAGKWGSVWSCPTAVGTTGIYFAFLKCAGSFVEDCYINTISQGSGAMRVSSPNWAIVGWTASSTQVSTSCFVGYTNTIPPFTSSSTSTPGYTLFLNDYAKGCTGQGFTIGDYGAVVGSLSYGNSFNGSQCFQGIGNVNQVPSSNPGDTGTHIFTGGSFSINNHNQPGCTDGNGYINDVMYVYNAQIVVEQSLIIGNGSLGISENGSFNVFPKVYQNITLWGNGLAQGSGRLGEIEFSNFGTGTRPTTDVTMNHIIAVATGGLQVCKYNRVSPYDCPNPAGFPRADDYALVVDTGACPGNSCSLSNSYVWDATLNNLTIIDPGAQLVQTNVNLANPGLAAPAQVASAPDCSTTATVIACVSGIINNFTPSGGAAGNGYQRPGACAPDPLYPIWLKGSVPDGILTKPCGY